MSTDIFDGNTNKNLSESNNFCNEDLSDRSDTTVSFLLASGYRPNTPERYLELGI
jgi:hypothetical protein